MAKAKTQLQKATQRALKVATHVSHRAEHPVHLVYFALVAFHSSYQLAALVCLVVGCFCLVPTRDQAEDVTEKEDA